MPRAKNPKSGKNGSVDLHDLKSASTALDERSLVRRLILAEPDRLDLRTYLDRAEVLAHAIGIEIESVKEAARIGQGRLVGVAQTWIPRLLVASPPLIARFLLENQPMAAAKSRQDMLTSWCCFGGAC